MKHRPIVLIVLDGWGHREALQYNAITPNSPYFQSLLARYPNGLLSASGHEVGLPLGLMGNSEVGHLNLGAGRIVYQEVTRIDKAIQDGPFFENGAIVQVMDRVRREAKRLHLLGLCSDGGVHSSDFHLRQLLVMAKRRGLAPDQVLVHVITDGRDTPPRSAPTYVTALEQDIRDAGVGRIATIVGRYWAMDRDKRWERTERAYDLYVLGVGKPVKRALDAVQQSHALGVGDEFIEPHFVQSPHGSTMQDGDGLFCFNFRADRMRQICLALGDDGFTGFTRKSRLGLDIATMTRYRDDFPFAVAYPPVEIRGIFPEIISAAGLSQVRMAETEKYAHVTFFFSGGREAEFQGERRVLVPSPKVATYDLQPQMSAPELCEAILAELARDTADVYVINFANSDMVGHTGIFDAACAAVRTLDACLKRIVPEVTRRGGVAAITADHGNAELMWDEEHNQPHTAHTTNPVPVVLCCDDLLGAKLRGIGTLADVAPTLLEIAGLEKSAGMDGVSLLQTHPSRA